MIYINKEDNDGEMCMRRKKNGFTLIELLVVIAIMLSILGIAIVSFINISNKKKEEAWQLVKEQIETAATEYLTANEYLFEGLTGDLTGYISVGKLVEEDYLNKVTDPRSNKGVSNKTYVEIKKDKNKIICKYNESENNRDINQNEYVIYVSEIGAPKISVSMPNNDDENLKINNGWYNEKTAPDGVVFSFSFGDNSDEVSTDKISVNSIETTEKPLFSSDSNLRIYESINGETKSDITDEIGYYNTSKMSGIKVDFKRILNIQGKNTVTYTVTKNGKSSNYTTEYKLDNEPPSINSFNVTGGVVKNDITNGGKMFDDDMYYNEVYHDEPYDIYKSYVGIYDTSMFYDTNFLYHHTNDGEVDVVGGKKAIVVHCLGHAGDFTNCFSYSSNKGRNLVSRDSVLTTHRKAKINLYDYLHQVYDYRNLNGYNGNIVNISGNISDNTSGIVEKELFYQVDGGEAKKYFGKTSNTEKLTNSEKSYIYSRLNFKRFPAKEEYTNDYLVVLNEDDEKRNSRIRPFYADYVDYSTHLLFPYFYAEYEGNIEYNSGHYEENFYYLKDVFRNYNLDRKPSVKKALIKWTGGPNSEDIKLLVKEYYEMALKEELDEEYAQLETALKNYRRGKTNEVDIYKELEFNNSGDFNLNNLETDILIDNNPHNVVFTLTLKDNAGNISERKFTYNTYVSCQSGNTSRIYASSSDSTEEFDKENTICECKGSEYNKYFTYKETDSYKNVDKNSLYTCSIDSVRNERSGIKTCPACPPVTNPNIEVDDDIETSDLEAFDSSDEQEMLESFDGD